MEKCRRGTQGKKTSVMSQQKHRNKEHQRREKYTEKTDDNITWEESKKYVYKKCVTNKLQEHTTNVITPPLNKQVREEQKNVGGEQEVKRHVSLVNRNTGIKNAKEEKNIRKKSGDNIIMGRQ